MKTQGHHVTLRLVEEGFIANGAGELRALSRDACGNARGLLAFRATENHVHVLLASGRAEAGAFARVALPALRRVLRLGTPFEAARIRPIADARHLGNSLAYVFEQGRRHQSSFDRPHDGSSLVDLLGLRCVDAAETVRRVRATFPRLKRAQLVSWLGLVDPQTGGPASAPALSFLSEAASAALGLARRELVGRAEPVRAAKRAAILVGRTWWGPAELRDELRLSARAFRRLEPARDAAPGPLERAVLGQLTLLSQLAPLGHLAWMPGEP